MLDLENMTLLELRNFAKEHNIKNISKLKKEELIVLLNQIKDSSKPKFEEVENEELYEKIFGNKPEKNVREDSTPLLIFPEVETRKL